MPIIPETAENIKQEDSGPGWPGQKVRPYLQNNQSKKSSDFYSSNCKNPEWNPEFKSHATKNEGKKSVCGGVGEPTTLSLSLQIVFMVFFNI
jgi:hypothetical protein